MKRIAALLVPLFAAACGTDYDHTDINNIHTSFSTADTISFNHVQVTEGQLVTAYISPFNDDDERMTLSFKLDRADVVDVMPVVNPHNYAFIGKQVGRAEVQFIADGEPIITVTVDVIPEPSPP